MLSYFLASTKFCRFASHYTDGMFLGSAAVLLSVMMVYKYWDSITKEDLEFSVGGAPSVWHTKPSDPNAESEIYTQSAAAMNEEAVPIHNKSFFY